MVEQTDYSMTEIEQLTDEEFAKFQASFPVRSKEEQEADFEEFMKHPLNCGEITPEMLEQPEFQALQQLAYEGTPDEVAGNFKNHAYEQLNKLVLNESKNNEKDF